MKFYAVRRKSVAGSIWDVVSAWPDVYFAKFEADRWEQDMKIPHDYVEGELTLVEESHAVDAHEEGAANVDLQPVR